MVSLLRFRGPVPTNSLGGPLCSALGMLRTTAPNQELQ